MSPALRGRRIPCASGPLRLHGRYLRSRWPRCSPSCQGKPNANGSSVVRLAGGSIFVVNLRVQPVRRRKPLYRALGCRKHVVLIAREGRAELNSEQDCEPRVTVLFAVELCTSLRVGTRCPQMNVCRRQPFHHLDQKKKHATPRCCRHSSPQYCSHSPSRSSLAVAQKLMQQRKALPTAKVERSFFSQTARGVCRNADMPRDAEPTILWP